ncbi:MAG: sulfotransferase [Gemmatimonadota bacterium]
MTRDTPPRAGRIVFLGGLHRSGTSLLFRCLRAHPEISGFADTGVPEDEGQHLQTVYLPARAHGGPGRFGFDPAAYLDERSKLVTEENRERLFGDWAPHWDRSRPLLLEKSPPNLIRSRFLQALFPQSSFIVLLRHPIVVSLATQKFSGTSVGSLLEHWVVCHERAAADWPHLARVRIVTYEELVARPGQVLRDLCGFLGVGPLEPPEPVDTAASDPYLRRWRRMRRSWRPLRSTLSRTVEELEPRVRRFGYSLEEPELMTGIPVALQRYSSAAPPT